jgi:hypothetical protein
MTIKNNWVTSSLTQRSSTNLCDFTLTINPHDFAIDTFKNNSIRVANEIYNAHDNVYVMYSGGLDSEYVLKTFLENNLSVTPVMIVTPYNKRELEYSIKFYRQNNIMPLVISYEKYEMFDIMTKRAKANGYFSLMCSLHLEICDIISAKGGKLVNGLGEPFTTTSKTDDQEILICEWELYLNQYDNSHPGSFFMYDLPLHYSLVNDIVFQNDIQKSKSDLYGLDNRPKMFWNKEFYDIANQLAPAIDKYQITTTAELYKAALQSENPTTFT